MAYRSSVHESTGETLNMLMLGREIEVPLDVVTESSPDAPPLTSEYAVALQQRLESYVTIGSIKSEDTLITHGVPQGSVLGPLLFLLYINDFSKCSNVFDFHIFADDTNLFYSNSNLAELESIVNYNLKMVSDWLTANKVSLNIDKTNFIIFHPPQKVKGHLVKLTIDKREIAQEKFIKYLGLIIDSHLSWKYHILHISKKIKRCIGILSKIRYSVTDVVLVQLYYSLIYPFLTYSLITWGLHIKQLSYLLSLCKKEQSE